MLVFEAEQLEKLSTRIFSAAGVPQEAAQVVSTSLVASNLVGHDSHGVIRIAQYLRTLRKGYVDPHAKIEVVRETPTSALLNANWAFGQIAAAEAMRMAIAKARANQIAAVLVSPCGHIGRLGEYTLMAAEHGCIGLAAVN
jgi:uncharacterized oxidoreductase